MQKREEVISADPGSNSSLPMLSEREERLLSQYFDGEAGFVNSLRARRMITQRGDAREFVRVLSVIRDGTLVKAEHQAPVGLWNRIEARIEQEQRSELFLGERRGRRGLAEPLHDGGRRLFSLEHLMWGISGGVVTAGVMVLLSSQALFDTRRYPVPVPIRLVSQSGPEQLARQPRVVEVDWMRSDGRVRMMHDPERSSGSIIWVQKRKPVSSGSWGRNRLVVVEPRRSSPIELPVDMFEREPFGMPRELQGGG